MRESSISGSLRAMRYNTKIAIKNRMDGTERDKLTAILIELDQSELDLDCGDDGAGFNTVNDDAEAE